MQVLALDDLSMAALYTQVGIPSSDNYRFSLRDPCCSNSNASNTHFFHGTSSTKIRNGRSSRRILVKSLVFWKPKAEKPSSVELKPISSEEQFDQILSESQQSSHAVIIDWMAQWCRKCIYLKPKLEKLGAEFYPEIQFYCVDVNAVPKALVERGGISKMPTIQLWTNGEKKAEVIGGHKAWMVLDEIRDMINKN